VEYRFRLPCRGDFYLIIFAHLEAAGDDNVPASDNVFKAVCEYKIVAGTDVPDKVRDRQTDRQTAVAVAAAVVDRQTDR